MKKLLAIVMVVAMMFSMSVVAMADEPTAAYATTTSVVGNEDGTKTATINIAGKVDSFEVRVYYGEATVESAEFAADYEDMMTMALVNNVAAEGYYVFTGASLDAAAADYNGTMATIVFSGVAEGATIEVVDGLSGATLESGVAIDVAAPTPEPTPEPTATPEPTPVPADPTAKPIETAAPAPTTAPVQGGTTTAPQTADFAPIATMITLAVVAGLAIVVLKKRATN